MRSEERSRLTGFISLIAENPVVIIGAVLGAVTIVAIFTIVFVVTKPYSPQAPLVLPETLQVTHQCKPETPICGFAYRLFQTLLQWLDFRKRDLHITFSPEDTLVVHPTPRNTEPSLSSSSSCQESRISLSSERQSSNLELDNQGGASGDEDEDELVSSAYDFPHLLVDMGEGDMVTAYRD